MYDFVCDVVIIDSGINKKEYIEFQNNIIGYYSFVDNTYEDNLGHGSAIFNIIFKENKNKTVFIIKLFSNSLEIEEEKLLNALQFVYSNIQCKILHMSLGIIQCENKDKLNSICKDLFNRGTLIVSAFDNMGAISYPAAFSCVLGIDISLECTKKSDYIVLKNNIVNIQGFGGLQRVTWLDNIPFAFVSGTSFAAANITSIILSQISDSIDIHNILDILEINALKCIEFHDTKSVQKPFLKKAIALPVNKEIQSLINYSDILPFELSEVYDIRQKGSINKRVSSIFNNSEYIVRDISEIDWSDNFDTVIIGHLSEMEKLLKKNLQKELIDKCILNQKNVISFDSLDSFSNIRIKNDFYSPSITREHIEHTFGKLGIISSPVLGVFGTSSHQGKYTIQLYLRKKFIQNGYHVAQLGTEPSAMLFGMDSVFPIGYNSSVNLNFREAISFLNNQMVNMDSKNPDIIIIGSQSNTALYWPGNISQYPTGQIELLMGTMPDAVILCVNPFDDFEYIYKTINVIESLSEAKVICLSLYPFTRQDNSYIFQKRKLLTKEELVEIKRKMKRYFNLPIYITGDSLEMDSIFLYCIDWFKKDTIYGTV